MINVKFKSPRSIIGKYSQQKHYFFLKNGDNYKVVAGPFISKTT